MTDAPLLPAAWLDDWLTRLAQLEPTLSTILRADPQFWLVGLNGFTLNAFQLAQWNTIHVGTGPIYHALLTRLQPPNLPAQPTSSSPYIGYSPHTPAARLEHLSLHGPRLELELRQAGRYHHVVLDAPRATEIDAEQDVGLPAFLYWVAQRPAPSHFTLSEMLQRYTPHYQEFLPLWPTLTALTPIAEADSIFVANYIAHLALNFPLALWVWRGLCTPAELFPRLERWLVQRDADHAAACAALTMPPSDFWAAPAPASWPTPPDAHWLAHLPPPTFWPTPAENDLFATNLTKLYQAVQRKIEKTLPPGAQP